MTTTRQFTSRGPGATLRWAGALGHALAARRSGAVVGLAGDMGAGKTTLVRGLVAALPGGHDAAVASPTWSLVHVYNTRPIVAHVDAWRLMPGDELGPLGLEQLPVDAILIVEWIHNVPELLERVDLIVAIDLGRGHYRRITVTARTAPGASALANL